MSVTTSQITLPARLNNAVVVIVVDTFVYIFVRTPYFAESVKTVTLCTSRCILAPGRRISVRDVDIDNIARELSDQVEHWNSRGSGFIIERVNNFIICITIFRPLHGSSYIHTTKRIADKHCTVNVKKHDQKCFLWSVLASDDRVTKYFPQEQKLNTTNLNFPLALKDISKFEILNPSVSVNVLSLDDKDFCIEYCSPERNRSHHVNLPLLRQGDKKHYVCIKTCPVCSVAELIIMEKHTCAMGVSIPFLPKTS